MLLECEISNVTIDPAKTALLIIDMQNFSLSAQLGSSIAVPPMFQAEDNLLKYAIPAARSAQIQIVWLNWGLTEEDLKTLPPAALRVFNWKAGTTEADYGLSRRPEAFETNDNFIRCGEIPRITKLGEDLGEVILTGGQRTGAGRALMKDTWNTALHGPLSAAFEESRKTSRPDVLIYKNRNSGLFDPLSDCNQFLRKEGIRTVLFAGMNTDQCVMGTLQDAHAGGFDTILLKDGCATDSPPYAQLSAEYNCCRNWGFVSTCRALGSAAAHLKKETENQ